MHREPQPAKLYTVAPMYRYAAPERGPLPRALAGVSVEAIGSDDPSIDAEVIQLYHALLGRLGVTQFHLELNSIGCRECRPAYLERCAAWLDANVDRLDEATREKAAASPLRVFDNFEAKPRGVGRRSRRRRRSASRCARRASSTSPPFGAISTRPASRTSSSRRSFAGSTTTRARPGSSSARWRTRTRRSRAAAATTASSRRSAARRRPASGSARGSSVSSSRMEHAGVASAEPPTIDVFFALDEGAPRERGRGLARRAPPPGSPATRTTRGVRSRAS